MFSLKAPSLFSFREQTKVERQNLQNMDQIGGIPSDTQMRAGLDRVKPNPLHAPFGKLFAILVQAGIVKEYRYWRDYVLVLVGGVAHFSSTKIHCRYSITCTRRDETTSYHYAGLAAMLIHSVHENVFPLDFEPILNQDGDKKNDCECNAANQGAPCWGNIHGAMVAASRLGHACAGGEKRMNEIYVSTDVETDGPIPGVHSMLSFGSAAYRSDKTLVSTFEANLEALPEALPCPKTMAWWETEPAAWAACREHLQAPETAMKAYAEWVKQLPGKPVFVGYPAAFDFLFVYWYLIRFVGESPFSHSALDIKTYAMALLKKGYRESTKHNMPKAWFDALPHTHRALDDAIEQGALFCNMLAANLQR